MAVLSQNLRQKFWFGTEDRMLWMSTPNRGASTGSEAWNSGGGTLNGGGFQLNSRGSHRNYSFEWPVSSSALESQTMKSFYDGSYGRGLVYFLDPLIYHQNVFPALWADPSIGIGDEGATLVYGVDPTSLPTSGWEQKNLPVRSASYSLNSVAAGWRGKTDAVFIPIPDGYTLSVGAIYSRTGTGGVFYRTQSKAGALGVETRLTELTPSSTDTLNTNIQGLDVAGAWFWVGRSSAAASSVTISAVTGRLIESAKTSSDLVATNLFTNPNLVGDGTYATVAENLFTNPNLVGDGTWAEVRRNYVPQPNFIVNSSWGANSATKQLLTDSTGTFLRVTRVGTTGDPNVNISFPLPPSGARNLRVMVRGNGVVKSQGSLALQESGPTYNGLSTSAFGHGTVVPAEWTEYVGSDAAFASTVTNARILLRPGQGDGEYLDYKFVYVGDVGGYFDGSTMDESMTQPEDFRVRWLGAENASESVMEIERVAGVIGSQCIPGVSTIEGRPAIRGIPTRLDDIPSDWARMEFVIPGAARALGTLVAKRKLGDGQNPSWKTALRAATPVQQATSSEAGLVQLSLNYSDITSGFAAQLGVGDSLVGSGDVWWTDIGLFAGNYTGGVFSGDTTPETAVGIVQPEDFRWRWTGAVDNSTSVMEIERVRGLLTNNCIAGVSSRDGKPAARLIPTGSSVYTSAYFYTPESARALGTFIGTVHQDSAVAPPLAIPNDRVANLVVLHPEQRPAGAINTPGIRQRRLVFSGLTGIYQALLYHGGAQGSGDVWWTDIGLFAGDYDGPAFSGSQGQVVIKGRTLRTQWDGAADNSTSSAWTLTTQFDKMRTDPWVGGQGHSGCRFTAPPTEVKYGPLNGGQVQFAASFKEVGSWLNG